MSDPVTTTLAASVGINDNEVVVANPAGITNPGQNQAFNETATYILVDQEWMEVSILYQLGSVYVPVIRGTDGTAVLPHSLGATVTITHKTPNSQFALPNS